jgi:TonB-dependent SusC/RagA subfamily outer membrane receptor
VEEPLYIVDGVIQTWEEAGLDAAEIQSIQVLKGGLASVLYGYGAPAARGVIIITTRRGAARASRRK